MAWLALILAIAKLVWEIFQFFNKLEGRHPLFDSKREKPLVWAAAKRARKSRDLSELEAMRGKYAVMCTELKA